MSESRMGIIALQGDGDVAGLGLRGEDGAQGLEGPLVGDGECRFRHNSFRSLLRHHLLKKCVVGLLHLHVELQIAMF